MVSLDRSDRCTVAGCERPVEAANLCAAHRYRARHGLPLSPPVRERVSAFERVVDSFYAVERASEEGGVPYHAAKVRLRAAVLNWIGVRGRFRRDSRNESAPGVASGRRRRAEGRR